jgi:hypothetical protein
MERATIAFYPGAVPEVPEEVVKLYFNSLLKTLLA